LLSTVSVGASLFFLAAVFPPYNVYIAQSISQKNLKKYLMIVAFSVLGLAIGSTMIYFGSQMIGFPIELIGGGIILYLAIKMFFKKEADPDEINSLELKENLSGAISCMIMSMLPGAYSITVAKGLATLDFFLVATVFLAGPILGTSFGGVLLYKGTKVSRIPLNKVGSILLLLVGASIFFDYFKHSF
jgi:hypothetical protein